MINQTSPTERAPRILLKIAAYRDPELPKTIRSAIAQADDPSRLRFAIVNQHDIAQDEISLEEWAGDYRFQVMNVHYTQTLGLGWARYTSDSMWRREEFTLQLDSHMRFDPSWDTMLVEDWSSRDDPRAVLTGYPKGYSYDADGNEITDPDLGGCVLYVSSVNAMGESALRAVTFRNHEQRILLVAGGFQFAPGIASREVPNDRRLQAGDELIHSLMLYTHGYNIYSPPSMPLSHFYLRGDKSDVRLPAQDFVDPTLARIRATTRDLSAKAHLDMLFGTGRGLGTVRSRRSFMRNLTGYMQIPWPDAWPEFPPQLTAPGGTRRAPQ